MAESKNSDMLSMSAKITTSPLNWTNYSDWNKTVRVYILGIEKEAHLTEDPPSSDDEKKLLAWNRADARLFFQIRNSIEPRILSSVSHCNTVKEIMNYLEFMFSGKGNITRVHEVCKGFYRSQQLGRPLKDFFLDFKRMYEEMKVLMSPQADLPTRIKNLELQAIISFLEALDPSYETIRSQILSSQELPSLEDVFSRVLRVDSLVRPPVDPNASALAGRGPFEHKNYGSKQGTNVPYLTSSSIICNYCKEPGHIKKNCRKLQNKQQRDQQRGLAHIAQSPDQSDSCSSSAGALATGTLSSGLATTSTKWVIDSGATDHMTGNHCLFSSYAPYANPSSIFVANGSPVRVLGSGTVKPTTSISLSSVLNVPDLTFNLLSPSKLTRHLNCFISLFPDHCLIQDLSTKQIIGRGYESGGHYILDDQVPRSVACIGGSPFEIHCRLGHVPLSSLKRMYPQFSSISTLDCESCQFAKHHRVHLVPRVNKRAASPFELVHSDVWGPCSVLSQTGYRYFVTFVDDFSRTTWLYLMKQRSELFTHFKNFCAEIHTQFNTPVKILRSDNAKEYFSTLFTDYMHSHGILHQSSCVDTPAQNGVAERKNRHLLETARALMFQSCVPKSFWADAVSTACFLINRMPSAVLSGDAPYSILFPTTKLFPIDPKIFGCVCFVRDVRPSVNKLDPKSLKCVFLGYSRIQKGYRCYSPDLHRYLVSTDVTFHESSPFFKSMVLSESPSVVDEPDDVLVYRVPISPVQTVAPEPDIINDGDVAHVLPSPVTASPTDSIPHSMVPNLESSDPVIPAHDPIVPDSAVDQSNDLPIALRKGTRPHCPPKRYADCTYPISSFVSYQHLSPASSSLVATLESISTPTTLHQALTHPGWRAAMEEEMMALEKAGTWTLTDLPSGKKAIGCKWVFTIKTKADGSLERLKARLVAKGYAQTYGIDYSETFSPVAKLTSVRLLASLAATYHWDLHQLDVKNAFLNGDLLEEVYMEQPPGFVAQGESRKVCYLQKSLYGLKQSPRAWFDRFCGVVKKFGLSQSKCDHSVFYQQSDAGMILLVVYVDDIVITGSNISGISELKVFLNSHFQTKDLGPLKYFLGIEVLRSKKGIFLTQRKYVLDLLKETGKLGAAPSSIPMISNPFLDLNDSMFDELPDDLKKKIDPEKLKPFAFPERYRRLIGKLNYLTVTHPDITFSVSILSRFMASLIVAQWEALEHILHYLKGSPGRGILYTDYGHTKVECFCDADHAGSKATRRSTTGYCVFVGGNLISWRSKKQGVVSNSSAEAEYRAMSQSVQEIVWVLQLMKEIGIATTMPAKLWCDNKAALHIASNSVFHERTKHIEIDCHFIRDKIKENVVSTGHVRSNDQLADLLTKALNGTRVEYLCNKLGMINIYAPT